MQKAVIAKLDEKFLETTTADADRFVYCNYVMPLLVTADDDVTPILPGYKRGLLNAFAYNGIIDGAALKKALPALGFVELVAINGLAFDSPPRPPEPGDDVYRRRSRSTAGALEEAAVLLKMVGNPESTSDKVLAEAVRVKIEQARSSFRNESEYRAFLPPSRPPPTVDEMIQFLIGLVQSDIAYFFLDRTRIRPKGFRIGEHVYALSIAGGEEVTLEQKTFTKRQTTFEEQNELETEFDLELSSTLSTELQEGFERQKAITDTWNFNVGKVGSYSSPVISDVAYGSFNTNHSFGYSKNVTDADQETRRRSTKDSQTASAKVAAKYRTAHKITFRVAAERGFETTTRRVIRNPNAFSPIALHYFKILQFVEMRHERYGLRLGWMPSVKDPAAGFFKQILAGKAQILSDAELSLPKKPEFKAFGPQGVTTTLLEKWFASPITDVGTGDGAGSIRTDVDVEVAFDEGWEWDGSVAGIDVIKLGPRPIQNYDAYVVGLPLVVPSSIGTGSGSALRVVVHVGAGVENQLPHRRMQFQINVRFTKLVQTNLPANTATTQEVEYSTALREWETKCEELRAAARKAAADWEAVMLRNLNPVVEMVGQLMKSLFPPNVRDEAWEIDLWQKIFELERASYVPYPGWWADSPLRDPTRDPSDFINASWARVYLPVRVGMERLALRWIHGRTTRALDAATEARFDAIEADLKQYRKDRFGDETEIMDPQANGGFREKYDTIAVWNDVMPTDGTHLEVLQASTMAADEMTLKDAEVASQLREALVESQKQDARLKSKAFDKMSDPSSVEVRISTGTPDEYQ